MIRILILDDEPDIIEMVKVAMEALGGYQVATCLTAAEARQAILAHPPDLAIIDLNLEKEDDGHQVIQWLRGRHPTLPVAVLTGFDAVTVQTTLEEFGVLEVIQKPLTIPQLQQRLQALVARLKQAGS